MNIYYLPQTITNQGKFIRVAIVVTRIEYTLFC